MMRRFHCLLLVPLLASPLSGQAVRYEVSVAQNQFHVTADFPTTGRDTLYVSLPAWSPGNYEIQNYAKYVRHFAAKTPAGRALFWDRLHKGTWGGAGGRSGRVTGGFGYLAGTPCPSRPPLPGQLAPF